MEKSIMQKPNFVRNQYWWKLNCLTILSENLPCQILKSVQWLRP